eukprot:189524-Prorocentrum_minimum.AAC.1
MNPREGVPPWRNNRTTAEGVDDAADFQATLRALAAFGVTNSERRGVLRVLAAVLHLGNLCFEDLQVNRGNPNRAKP